MTAAAAQRPVLLTLLAVALALSASVSAIDPILSPGGAAAIHGLDPLPKKQGGRKAAMGDRSAWEAGADAEPARHRTPAASRIPTLTAPPHESKAVPGARFTPAPMISPDLTHTPRQRPRPRPHTHPSTRVNARAPARA
jgi:hypothetical protein